MKVIDNNGRYLARFEVGEKLPDALVALAQQRGWSSGSIMGIGGVRDVVLAYYDLSQKKYLQFSVEGIVELVSIIGNLALVDGKPFWHLHASVANASGDVKAGHLVALTVAITVECWIQPGNISVSRSFDEASGLNLLSI